MNNLTCSFLLSVKLRHWLFMANYGLFPGIRLWGKGVGGGGDSLTLPIRRCAAEQGMVFGSFVYNFRSLSCIFINRHVLWKLYPNSEQTIQEPLIFQVGPILNQSLGCTYTLINDPIYPRTLWLSALGGYSIMAYTGSFRQRGAFFRLNVYKL